ncbi:MAG TPA: ROK family protein [Candidatus Binatia bacterium]|nr:ROK family protein [Candidatus Binatia bacterium]
MTQQPNVITPLQPEFQPAVLAMRARKGIKIELALERSPDSISRAAADVPDGDFRLLERWVKFLLWSRGAHRVHFSGPKELCEQLRRHYAESATGKFDAEIMGRRIYERAFEVVWCEAEKLPAGREQSAALGGHLNGCRIGFDLGASDRKIAAVIDGEPVFTEEVPWDPRAHSDPQWHFEQINDCLRRAASHLPRVDAIGGSAAGVYVNNQVKVASLFRGIPEDLFARRIKGLFQELKKAWNNIPFEVVNDGEVTALAGAIALKSGGVLGISMGSSQAGGYVTPEGQITSWLNELAFAPIDYNPNAPVDEWSGDYGCGVQYFSQQAVGRLIAKAGLPVRSDLPLPEKLVKVQKAMATHDERAASIYHTIGVCFGYAAAHYASFYDFKHLLLLGRVTTGEGGAVIISQAERVLREEFPDLKIHFHMPDEKEKRHGQAIAAASLPLI